MGKMIDLRTKEQKHHSKSPAGILEASIRDRVWKLANAIGALRTAAQVAVMSSMMIEAHTDAGQSKLGTRPRYLDFVKRADPLPKRKDAPALDALRRSIWKRVRKHVKLVGSTQTASILLVFAEVAAASERDWEGLRPGPEVSTSDFAKRADGTSLL